MNQQTFTGVLLVAKSSYVPGQEVLFRESMGISYCLNGPLVADVTDLIGCNVEVVGVAHPSGDNYLETIDVASIEKCA